MWIFKVHTISDHLTRHLPHVFTNLLFKFVIKINSCCLVIFLQHEHLILEHLLSINDDLFYSWVHKCCAVLLVLVNVTVKSPHGAALQTGNIKLNLTATCLSKLPDSVKFIYLCWFKVTHVTWVVDLLHSMHAFFKWLYNTWIHKYISNKGKKKRQHICNTLLLLDEFVESKLNVQQSLL